MPSAIPHSYSLNIEFPYLRLMKWSLSWKAMMFCMLVLLVIRLFIAPMEQILTWDVFGYYLYLPSYFIYDDPTLQKMDWVNSIIDQYQTTGSFYQAVHIESGNWVMRYPIGAALLNSPFFFTADFLAEPMGYARDGFSTPYQAAWTIGALFYALLGIYFTRKVLLKLFSDSTTAILLVLLCLGTNFIQMATYGNPLSHIFLFALYAFAINEVINWKEEVSWKSALRFGLFTGLIAITRPNEIAILLIPIFWNWKGNIIGIIQYYLKNKIAILCIGVGAFITALPQLIYWKLSSGQWLFYSYQDPGVGFDFLSPHTFDFLFSFRKGWFIYTPLMFFATLGFIQLYRKRKDLFLPLFIFFLFNLYIVSAWSCWWYAGGSYSSRSLVSTYLIMAIPMGFGIDWLRTKSSILKKLAGVLALLFIALNLFQFWQFQTKVLDGDRMTFAYYKAIFLQTERPANAEDLLMTARQAEPFELMPEPNDFRSEILSEFDFSKMDSISVISFKEATDTFLVFRMDEKTIFTPAFESTLEQITSEEYAWLRIEAEVFIPDSSETATPLLVAHFLHKGKPYLYTTTETKPNTDFKGKAWQILSLDIMTPEARSWKDGFKTYLWYRAKNPVYIRSFKLTKFEPKGD